MRISPRFAGAWLLATTIACSNEPAMLPVPATEPAPEPAPAPEAARPAPEQPAPVAAAPSQVEPAAPAAKPAPAEAPAPAPVKRVEVAKPAPAPLAVAEAPKPAPTTPDVAAPEAKPAPEAPPAAPVATTHAKVGDKKCKMCHRVQHASWAASPHAAKAIDCEACHGNGSDYWPASVMRDRAKAVAAGLALPELSSCRKCHPNADAALFANVHAHAAK